MGHSSVSGLRRLEWEQGATWIGLRGSGGRDNQELAVGGRTLRGVSGVVSDDKASAVEVVVGGVVASASS